MRTTTHHRHQVRLASLLFAALGLTAGVGVANVTWGGANAEATTEAGSRSGTEAGAETEAETEAPAGPVTEPGDGELNPELQRRFDDAVAAAAADGVDLTLNSGWRSEADQERLIEEMIAYHGTARRAHQFVAPVDRSSHVTGLAIDVGPPAAAQWLDENGARFGLCRVYQNESWHFEPTIAPGGTCPALLANSAVLWDDTEG